MESQNNENCIQYFILTRFMNIHKIFKYALQIMLCASACRFTSLHSTVRVYLVNLNISLQINTQLSHPTSSEVPTYAERPF